jgi:hypothetical protein
LGFVFLMTEDFLYYFKDFIFKSRDIGEPNSSGQYTEGYYWLIRQIKKGKDPKTDKYDPQIIFGFKLDEVQEKVIPYLYKDRKHPLKISLDDKNKISFQKYNELTKFPTYMIEEERLKFSMEMRAILLSLGTEKVKLPSKFFIRWYPDVIFPTKIREKLSKIVPL